MYVASRVQLTVLATLLSRKSVAPLELSPFQSQQKARLFFHIAAHKTGDNDSLREGTGAARLFSNLLISSNAEAAAQVVVRSA